MPRDICHSRRPFLRARGGSCLSGRGRAGRGFRAPPSHSIERILGPEFKAGVPLSRAAVQCIRAFPCLDLDELASNLETLRLGELSEHVALTSMPSPERPCSAVLTRT